MLAGCDGFSDKTKLYLLLMLNCGMYQNDIAELLDEEVNWKNGTITRARSKTRDRNGPVVTYKLWPETFALLKKHNRALCVAESEERNTPDVVTADFCYYRYRKPGYTPEEHRSMVERMREHLGEGRDVFAYFKHEETPEGALYAVEMLKQVQEP